VEFIGFFISLLALIYLYYRQYAIATRRRQQRQEAGMTEEESEDPLRVLMEEMVHKDELEKQRQMLPPPLKKAKRVHKKAKPSLAEYHLESDLEKRKIKSALQKRHLQPSVAKNLEDRVLNTISLSSKLTVRPSKAMGALKRLSHRRDLLIYQEIIDQPRSLRPFK
jgi:hypothetical protein